MNCFHIVSPAVICYLLEKVHIHYSLLPFHEPVGTHHAFGIAVIRVLDVHGVRIIVNQVIRPISNQSGIKLSIENVVKQYPFYILVIQSPFHNFRKHMTTYPLVSNYMTPINKYVISKQITIVISPSNCWEFRGKYEN